MDEIALRYEYVIRASHNVGRLGIPSAHADTYRRLENNFVIYRDNKKNEISEELLFKYAYYCGEVATNIYNASWQVEKDLEKKLNQEDKDNLEKIDNLLVYPKMNEIEEALIALENILKRHGKLI